MKPALAIVLSIISQVAGQRSLRSPVSVNQRELESFLLNFGGREAVDASEREDFNLCNFVVQSFLKGDNLQCGCDFSFFGQTLDFNCVSQVCFDDLCVDPTLRALWSIADGLSTSICTPAKEAVTLDMSARGGSNETTFDMPDFCLDLDTIPSFIPSLAGCTAKLGDHTCGCRICDSGVDVELDCSGATAELPESVAAAANFGCVGITSIFQFYDPSYSALQEAPAFPINPIYLLADDNY